MTAAGMLPAIRAIAARDGITEEEAWRRRENEALARLADARASLTAYQDAIDDGLLPALTTTGDTHEHHR